MESALKCYSMRLKPGDEIRTCLLQFARKNKLRAAFIITCCGSVTKATLRTAAGKDIKEVWTHIFYTNYFYIYAFIPTYPHTHTDKLNKHANINSLL